MSIGHVGRVQEVQELAGILPVVRVFADVFGGTGLLLSATCLGKRAELSLIANDEATTFNNFPVTPTSRTPATDELGVYQAEVASPT